MPKGLKTSREVLAQILTGRMPSWCNSDDRHVSLHTADPSAGDQSVFEVSYFGYARQPAKVSDWEQDADTYVNTKPIEFPITVGIVNKPITHIAIGTVKTGNGQLLYVARLKRPISLKINQRLRFEAGDLVISEN